MKEKNELIKKLGELKKLKDGLCNSRKYAEAEELVENCGPAYIVDDFLGQYGYQRHVEGQIELLEWALTDFLK